MATEQWGEIHGFRSPEEFARFEVWITARIAAGELRETRVEQAYGGSVLDESWFRSRSGAVWRLVAPEHPFLGVFEIVS